jgi:hypothetical protein
MTHTNLHEEPSVGVSSTCRHAIAHGGTISLTGNEPRLPAEWNGIAITKESQGTPLFAYGDTPGLLGAGDPLYLLWDLEQTI